MVGSLLGKRQLSYGDDDEASSVAESNRNLVILSSQRPQFDLSQEASRMMESSCGNSGSGDSYLEKLPRRLICCVISYIGPCSSALVNLAGSSSMLRNLLNDMGGRMLVKANFREPLQRQFLESNISLFVRHTRACRHAYDTICLLEEMISRDVTSLEQVHACINVADSLLRSQCSRLLEQRLLKVCGKCGGKAFKFCKKVHDLFGLDKARLIMQLVLVRENRVVNEFFDNGLCNGPERNINQTAVSILYKVWKRRLEGTGSSDGFTISTDYACSKSVVVEDF